MTFDIKSIRRTRTDQPERLLVYGPHKIGKSTFASCAPSPIFIQTEDGLDAIDANAFPLARSWQDVLDAVAELYNGEHSYKTIVLDSADWAEKLAFDAVCSEHNVKSIEAIGYGKGYAYSCDKFRELLDGLNALRSHRQMRVILLAHTEIRRFDDPTSDAYDRYQIKLSKAIGKLVQEWADVIGFAQLDTITKTDKGSGGFDKPAHNRAITTGERVLRLVGGPSYDAGNRYGLPDSVSLVWDNYQAAMDAARTTNKESNDNG